MSSLDARSDGDAAWRRGAWSTPLDRRIEPER